MIAGKESLYYAEEIVSKDSKKPTDISLNVKTVMSQTIAVEATGRDNGGSGIYTYKFMYKTSNSNEYKEADTITVDNEETCEYIYKELTGGQSYNLKVIVADRAGNEVEAKGFQGGSVDTDDSFVTKDWIAQVGDFVDYKPTGSNSMSTATTVTPALSWGVSVGINATSTIQRSEMQWKILSINEDSGYLTLIGTRFNDRRRPVPWSHGV